MKKVMICVFFVDREGNGQGQLLCPNDGDAFWEEIEIAVREGIIGSAGEAADFVADLLNQGSETGQG